MKAEKHFGVGAGTGAARLMVIKSDEVQGEGDRVAFKSLPW